MKALKEAPKNPEIKNLYEDKIVFITPHVSKHERNLVKQKTSSSSFPSQITISNNSEVLGMNNLNMYPNPAMYPYNYNPNMYNQMPYPINAYYQPQMYYYPPTQYGGGYPNPQYGGGNDYYYDKNNYNYRGGDRN